MNNHVINYSMRELAQLFDKLREVSPEDLEAPLHEARATIYRCEDEIERMHEKLDEILEQLKNG